MTKSFGLAILATATLTASVALAQDQAPPDLMGEWSGTYTGGVRSGGGQLEPASNPAEFVEPGSATYTLAVTEQQGRGFTGTWSAELGSEALQGVIRLDDRTILMIDDDTLLTGTLLSENEMELCGHWLSPEDRFSHCFLLIRK